MMKWRIKILRNQEHVQAKQELRILEDEVAATYKFLRSHSKKKVPIYLLLGPSSFGKTTILSYAGLNLKNVNQESLINIVPTKYCSFWLAPNAIYIDTAGTYTKPEIAKPRNDLIWQGFIKLLQKYFGKNSIAGALIILDLPAIAQDANLLKKTLFCIRERVYELAAFVKNIPLHIIFTKCDRILGFTEFFSQLDNKNYVQPFGIAFTDTKEKINPVLTFEAKFNKLLTLLNRQVIEFLQKTTSKTDRTLIKKLPTQFNSLRQIFLEVLSKIPSGYQMPLSGMYFTSSIQDGTSIDFLKHTVLHAFNLKEKPSYNLENTNNHSYFVEDIFKKVITQPIQHKEIKRKLHLPQVPFNYLYTILVFTIILGLSIIVNYKSYQKNMVALQNTRSFLQTPLTEDLDNLYSTTTKLEQSTKSWWLKLGINEIKPLYHSLKRTYHIIFIQTLVIQLENIISTELHLLESTNDPQKLYETLQAYLMFNDPKKLDPIYIKKWFDNYWTEIYNTNTVPKIRLQQQLNAILQHPFKTELNQKIINTAREKLNALPPNQLIYLLLNKSLDNQYLVIDPTIPPVPKIYTREYFNKIYHKTIPDMVNNLPRGDWVLGDQLKLQLTDTTENTINSIRELYLKKYLVNWETIINYEPKIEITNLHDAANDLHRLASNDSPIVKLLQQIIYNINIDNAPSTFTNAITTTKLQNLTTLKLNNLQQNLTNLANYFTTIDQSNNPNKAAFTAAINYLQNPHPDPLVLLKDFAHSQPQPVQQWLLAIVDKSFATLITIVHTHINDSWHTIVLPQYEKILVNKYPIFKESKNDISLKDFNRFFGPDGIIDNFFNTYIRPFVNMDTINWSWKSFDGTKINLSQDSLEVFLRAALIQKMFFSQKTSTPKIQFALTPVDMTPNTQGCVIHIDGQKVTYTNEDQKRYSLVWPGPNPGLVTIDFTNREGKYYNTSQFGTWAWFRTLDKSNLTASTNTRQFNVTFDLNGNAAKYELSTNESINAFIPNIINNFRCPELLN